MALNVYAQNNRDYQIANRMMQQQQYAEALPVLEQLNREYPLNYEYADRFIDCLIQLKQYDRALSVAWDFKDQQGIGKSAGGLATEPREAFQRSSTLYDYRKNHGKPARIPAGGRCIFESS